MSSPSSSSSSPSSSSFSDLSNLENISVRARSTETKTYTLSSGDKFEWKFNTGSGGLDIEFSVKFIEQNKISLLPLPPTKVLHHTGSYTPTNDGILAIIFDNTYSK